MIPLVLVHGFMGGSAQWAAQQPLSEGRALVEVDLPGFGSNAHLPAISRIEDFAAWVLDETARRGVDRFDLLGHSMGGMIVQEMVRLAPDRVNRLILHCTGAVGELPGRFEPIETSIRRVREDGAHATARRISATWFLRRESADAFEATAVLAEQASLEAMLAGLQAMQRWSGEGCLADIRSRTLILWADRDRTYAWAQAERLWQGIPDSALAVVPDCAHAVHAEAPTMFNAIVQRFLDDS